MLDRSLPQKSRKGLARDVIDTCTAYAGLIHNVRDAGCYRRSSRAHGLVPRLLSVDLLMLTD